MDMLHVNTIMLHVDINKWHVNINTLQYDFVDMQQTKFESHFNIIISHTYMDTLHVNMIMLHVVINKWYVNISTLHDDIIYLACRGGGQKYATALSNDKNLRMC